MKCPNCNYEQGWGWHDRNGVEVYDEVNPNEKKFLQIKGSFFAEKEGSFGGTKEVDMYACPICNVVILSER